MAVAGAVKRMYAELGIPYIETRGQQGTQTLVRSLMRDSGFVVSAAATAGTWGLMAYHGMPFPQFDKLAHVAGGYMVSKVGIHVSKAYNRGRRAAACALLLTAAAGAAVELSESVGPARGIGSAVGLRLNVENISYGDILADFAGWGAQTLRNRRR